MEVKRALVLPSPSAPTPPFLGSDQEPHFDIQGSAGWELGPQWPTTQGLASPGLGVHGPVWVSQAPEAATLLPVQELSSAGTWAAATQMGSAALPDPGWRGWCLFSLLSASPSHTRTPHPYPQ